MNGRASDGWDVVPQQGSVLADPYKRISYACSPLVVASLEAHSAITEYDNQMAQRDKSCYLLNIKRSLGSRKKNTAGAIYIVSSFHENT